METIKDLIFAGKRVEISNEIVETINKLNIQVSSPSYVRTPNFKRGHNEHKEWESIRSFKATRITEVKKDIDLVVNEIRHSLNKLTEDNFESTHSYIVSKMNAGLLAEDLMKVSQLIFKISTQNRFMSSAYAKLYMLLMKSCPTMANMSEASLEGFMDVFDDIKYVNPEEDYDGYCRMNETNEYRRALTVFFVNLMNIGVIEPNRISLIVVKLQETIFDNANLVEKRKMIDEIGENIFLLITLGKEKLRTADNWDAIVGNITNVRHINNKEYRGITSKTVFKHADIIDSIKALNT
jgi:hypothetical protein